MKIQNLHMSSDAESPSTSAPAPAGEGERRLIELRGRISDIGYEIDSAKAVTGMGLQLVSGPLSLITVSHAFSAST